MKRQDGVLLGVLLAATFGLLAYGAYAERNTGDVPGSSSAASLAAAPPSALPSASAPPTATRKSVTATQLLGEICGPANEASCDCRKRATLAAFDRRAPGAALDIVHASLEACQKGALLGLEAEALARNAQSERALEEARRILAVDPNNPYATYATALAYEKTGKQAAAFDAARNAVKLGRGATAHVLLGLLEYQNKNFDEAEDAFEKALEVDPKSVEAMFNLAVLNQRRNDYHRTREGYLSTLRLDPT